MMTASNKYYFRKKSRTPVPVDRTRQGRASSTDSDDLATSLDESKRVTLHVITDPGQSHEVSSTFQSLLERLDPSLDVVCVSESAKPRKLSMPKNGMSHHSHPQVPSVAIVLFFDDNETGEYRHQDDTNNNNFHPTTKKDNKRTNNFTQVRQIFSRSPWKFHHRVAITGKLMSCDSNAQDFFKYDPQSVTPQSRDSGRRTPLPVAPPAAKSSTPTYDFYYPIWGVRKVHYGKQVLRFNLFTSHENWEDQIKLYRLILRKSETKVRDDFCYFSIFSNQNTEVQFALKKLPKNLKPHPLRSTIVQFRVRNVGQLVPLLPHSCEPISELRWRTRDHDSNLLLLQINRQVDVAAEQGFAVESALSDYDSPTTEHCVVTNSKPTRPQKVTSCLSSIHDVKAVANGLSDIQVTPKIKPRLHPRKIKPAHTSSSTSPSTSPERSDVTPRTSRAKFEYFSTSRSPTDVTGRERGVFV